MTSLAFRKILVAFDGSPSSVAACDLTAILAKAFKSNVTIGHVLPPITALSAAQKKEYEISLENKANILTMKMASRLENEGIEAKPKILRSKESIWQSLVDLSKMEKSDLIVAGTRGLGAFRRMVLGSVSTNLVNHAPCSVLVVRKRVYRIETEFRKILVATDGSKSANKAVETAASLAKNLGADLKIAYIVYTPPYTYAGGGYAVSEVYKNLREDGEKIVSEAAKLANENGVHPVTQVIDNQHSPVQAIVNLAEEEKSDLIVMGTRGLGGVKKVFLGSVANGVVHYAKCSVLVTR